MEEERNGVWGVWRKVEWIVGMEVGVESRVVGVSECVRVAVMGDVYHVALGGLTFHDPNSFVPIDPIMQILIVPDYERVSKNKIK